MIRVKIVQDHKQYTKGQTLQLSPNEAFGLIDSGVAVISKDMTQIDYKRGSFSSKKIKRK